MPNYEILTERNKEICNAYKSGASIKVLSKSHGIAENTIYRILYKNSVPIIRKPTGKYTSIRDDFDNGMSIKELTIKYNKSYDEIRKIIECKRNNHIYKCSLKHYIDCVDKDEQFKKIDYKLDGSGVKMLVASLLKYAFVEKDETFLHQFNGELLQFYCDLIGVNADSYKELFYQKEVKND